MKMRDMRFLMALIVLASTIVPGMYALQDYNPNGYVDDLSSLPTPGQQNSVQQSMMNAVSIQYHALCAASLTIAGFTFLYMVNAEFRKKVHAWLGLHMQPDDEQDASAV